MKNVKLLLIDRNPKTWWRQQTYPSKPVKVSKRLMRRLWEKIQIAEECMRHHFDYALMKDTYRKYRRGKNRCKNCGIKLN